jgi:S-adenosylmethionine hydrolase
MNITLLSDLGMRDAAAATAKAVLMTHAPGSVITDISHNVVQFDVRQAAYLLRVAYRHFPQGTVHITTVDVFSGDTPRLLLAEHDGYFFIVPDNGILQLAFRNEITHVRLCFQLNKPYNFSQWLDKAAKVIDAIQNKQTESFTPYPLKPLARQQLKQLPQGADCTILYVDRYENVVLDLTRAEFNELIGDRSFTIKILRAQDITTISGHYNEVKEGHPLCRFNSAGYMEIAVNHGSAASLLGIDAQNQGSLRYKTVRIFLK